MPCEQGFTRQGGVGPVSRGTRQGAGGSEFRVAGIGAWGVENGIRGDWKGGHVPQAF